MTRRCWYSLLAVPSVKLWLWAPLDYVCGSFWDILIKLSEKYYNCDNFCTVDCSNSLFSKTYPPYHLQWVHYVGRGRVQGHPLQQNGLGSIFPEVLSGSANCWSVKNNLKPWWHRGWCRQAAVKFSDLYYPWLTCAVFYCLITVELLKLDPKKHQVHANTENLFIFFVCAILIV